MGRERIRVTVIGDDKAGIIAEVTRFLFKNGLNIEDLNQTVMEGKFIMNIESTICDLKIPFGELKEQLKNLGQNIGMKIRTVREKVSDKKRVALLVTKEPHCLEDLIARFDKNDLNAEVSLVISNHEDLRPLAKKNNLQYEVFSSKIKKENEKEILKLLDKKNIDLVVLARYMQILSPEFCFRYEGRIINIHPSLLPAFPGPSPYVQALEKGVSVIGVTAHFVTTDLDRGPIIFQDSFKIDPSKEISKKEIVEQGRKLESKVLTKSVEYFLQDKIFLRWGKVRFKNT